MPAISPRCRNSVIAGQEFSAIAIGQGTDMPDGSSFSRCKTPDADGIVHHNFWRWMFGFTGRISRAQWWVGHVVLCFLAVLAVLAGAGIASVTLSVRFPDAIADIPLGGFIKLRGWRGTGNEAAIHRELQLFMRVTWYAACLLVLWMSTALAVKRLHDRGLSGWLAAIVLVPFAGLVAAPRLLAGTAHLPEIITGLLLIWAAAALWAVIQFGLMPGARGANWYGGNPLKKSFPS